eukprot:m.343400 g.343400  ORF g.343400 m.343400 type:complete len:429 (+) comp22791_c0_seq1:271-1557(+)
MKSNMAVSIVFVLVIWSFVESYEDGSCKTAMDCHLNGVCSQSKCACRPAWNKVPNCSEMNILPAKNYGQAYLGFNTNSSSWGGSVVYDPTDKLYHMFVAEFINNCGLYTWHPNSQIVHATSKVPEGPYTKEQVVMNAYAHGPSASRDPVTGMWVLSHLGSGTPDNTPRPLPGVAGISLKYCKNGNSYNTSNSSHPGFADSKTIKQQDNVPTLDVQGNYMLYSHSPYGPWKNGTNMPPAGGNSVPLFYPNGSVLVVRQGLSNSGPHHEPPPHPGGPNNGSSFLNYEFADSFQDLLNGSFVSYGPDNITVSPWTHWEDVFMWTDEDGYYHCLFHAVVENWENSSYATPQPGGHAYSLDGLHWIAQRNAPYGFVIDYDDGSTWTMEARERPHLIFNSKGQPTHLFNGVNPFGYFEHTNDHSFTQVVPIATS